MKRVIITILIFLFGIGCGFGAFFMLKTGGNMKKEELKSVQRLEVPETETKASKEQKKKEEPKNSEQVKEKDDVPNFGTPRGGNKSSRRNLKWSCTKNRRRKQNFSVFCFAWDVYNCDGWNYL